jgi:predicted metal-dependent phosphoesterase TrpH
MLAVDLHTHSIASPDGGIALAQYANMLDRGILDVVAITDHNTIAFALQAQARFGEAIIVGEEIQTTEGEIIGLYLTQAVAPLQPPEKTIEAIRSQGGLVYIPHPFETIRKGVSMETLGRIAQDVDIIEVYNGRVMQKATRTLALDWAATHSVAAVASSDAHGARGWGRTYSCLQGPITREALLRDFPKTSLVCKDVGMIGRLYPSLNRVKQRLQKHA